MSVNSHIRLHRGSRLITMMLTVAAFILLLTARSEAARFLTPLKVQPPTTELSTPQMAALPVRWAVESSGGVSPFRYRYFLGSETDKTGILANESRQQYWDWTPEKAGLYRVRVQIEDDRGMLVESAWSLPFEIVPALRITTPYTDLKPPAMSRMQIPWKTTAQGGRKPYRYAFQWRLTGFEADKEIETPGPEWLWEPIQAGTYQVRAIIRDSLDNQATSEWSSVWRVNPVFQMLALTPNRLPALADAAAEVVWSVESEGGTDGNLYRFALYRDDVLVDEAETATTASWTVVGWTNGRYRVQVSITDSYGNQVEGWSDNYRVGIETIAILPIYNLSDVAVPSGSLRNGLETEVRRAGFELLTHEQLETFMAEHRWRHSAYLPEAMAASLREQLQVDAVLLTGVLDYQESEPPQVTLVSRLVGTGMGLPIIWADGVAEHGESAPGFLGLGRITSIEPLKQSAFQALIGSMVTRTETEPEAAVGESTSVVLFPFYNHTELDRGGEILAAQMLINMVKRPGIRVVEPGLVRDRLLHYRIIAPYGPSEADLSLLQAKLDADLVITGALTHHHQSPYDPVRIPPETSFSMKVIDLQTQEQIAQDSVFGKGDDRVYFYDFLRHWTVYDLTDHLLNKMLRRWTRNHG